MTTNSLANLAVCCMSCSASDSVCSGALITETDSGEFGPTMWVSVKSDVGGGRRGIGAGIGTGGGGGEGSESESR
jgi:hypothetical protein